MKKIINLLTICIATMCVMIGMTITASANTEGYYTYTISNNMATITDVSTSINENAIIPTTLGGCTVTTISDSAFAYCDSLQSITIPDSVTTIGSEAFYYCISLKSITIGNSVTSVGDYAFAECKNLTSIVIPNSVTSIGKGAFNFCTNLKSITIGDSVTSIEDYTFYHCDNLESIIIPDSVTTIGDYAFEYNDSLTNVTIGNGVTSIGEWTFGECKSLTSIVIPNSVTSIGKRAFSYCDNLTGVTIGNGVTSIDRWAFSNCISLESITIPDSLTSIPAYAFESCTSLTSITIPNSITTIDGDAFEDCNNLNNVYITDIGAWCNIYFTKYESSQLYNAKKLYVNNTLVDDIVIPDGVTYIYEGRFANFESIKSVTFPDSVYAIGKKAFSGCKNLSNVVFSDYANDVNIKSEAFSNCTNLNNFKLPKDLYVMEENVFYNTGFYNNKSNWDNGILYSGSWILNVDKTVEGEFRIKDGIYKIAGNAFSGSNIKKLYIPKSMYMIDSYAFADCKNLEYVEIANGVTEICAGAFANCTSLSNISIPTSVKWVGEDAFFNTVIYNDESNWQNGALYVNSILADTVPTESREFYVKDGTTVIAGQSFMDAKYEKIILPSSVKTIGNLTFYRCSNLTSISLPQEMVSISSYAFGECKKLKSVTLPDKISYLSNCLFENCTELESVTIPESINTVYGQPFKGCIKLRDIYFKGTQDAWKKIIQKYNLGISLDDVSVHFIEPPYIDATVSADGKSFVISPKNIENGNLIILALYNGDTFVKLYNEIYQGQDIPFNNVNETYDKVKIMAWENFDTLKPLCDSNDTPTIIE